MSHRGIIELVGVVTAVPPVIICTKLMANGDLSTFLQECRPTLPAPRFSITFGDVVTMAERLASGCVFLEDRKIVHRNLKARNVLVGDTAAHVVLANLGEARSTFTRCEYTSSSGPSPARWMAPESMLDAKFTNKSDVWSFGVLLWEITALGEQPWAGLKDQSIFPELQAGNRLKEQLFSPCVSRATSFPYALPCSCFCTRHLGHMYEVTVF